eukprot:TRINITY_DN22255_c0_g1_i1.p1 TRINITY_DN22255_c0_g1~~TRINITY_DN22255_c0_g1_i1.p1  ORF type:complete len:146 (+),score=18.99 TRINITY_DN22255_c0_g1_i1:64-438(+)
MAPPHVLVFDLHVRLLQCLSDEANVHSQGLTQAAVFFKRQGKLDNQTVKRIGNLDQCYHVSRHVAQAYCDTMCDSIRDKIKQDSCHKDGCGRNGHGVDPGLHMDLTEVSDATGAATACRGGGCQ